ncbi:phage tail protein [Ruthenibacterium lactatiformans]|uniref:phage tail protein n=1 Tax=Ruthenibacterium lactatiformans TaxID=1550024 RepID=UPI003AB78F88
MAISIEFKDKYVYFGPEAGLHTQGEARAEVYDVTGPRYHDGHDLSAMTWYVRASHPDYMTIINKQLRVSVAPGNEEQIIVTWPVDADFTAYAGQLDVQFVVKSSTGEEIIKLQSNGLQFAASVEGTAIPPRNMFEDAVSRMKELADAAEDAAVQSRLDADRAGEAQEAAAGSASAAAQSKTSAEAAAQRAENAAGQIEGDAEAAAASAAAAKTSETNAAASKTAAANSASAAKTSETNAASSKTAAENSAAAAKTSETNAASSKNAAAGSASAAAQSKTSAEAAAQRAENAAGQIEGDAASAAASAAAAKTSETNAAASKTAAANSASAAKTSETNAASSKTAAENSAAAAKTSETNAASSKNAAAGSASAAAQSKSAAEAAAKRAEDAAGQIDMSNYLLKTGDGKDVTVAFSPSSAADFSAPVSGSKLSAVMVMLSKWRNYISRALVPTGTVLAFAGSSAPSGFLLCDGRAVSRTTYTSLFSVIGTTYGSGDGSTTFNLPDMRGRVAVGSDANLGAKAGAKTHALTNAELPVLSGAIVMHSSNVGTNIQTVNGVFKPAITNNGKYRGGGELVSDVGTSSVGHFSLNIGGGQAISLIQPSLYLNYLIKV